MGRIDLLKFEEQVQDCKCFEDRNIIDYLSDDPQELKEQLLILINLGIFDKLYLLKSEALKFFRAFSLTRINTYDHNFGYMSVLNYILIERDKFSVDFDWLYDSATRLEKFLNWSKNFFGTDYQKDIINLLIIIFMTFPCNRITPSAINELAIILNTYLNYCANLNECLCSIDEIETQTLFVSTIVYSTLSLQFRCRYEHIFFINKLVQFIIPNNGCDCTECDTRRLMEKSIESDDEICVIPNLRTRLINHLQLNEFIEAKFNFILPCFEFQKHKLIFRDLLHMLLSIKKVHYKKSFDLILFKIFMIIENESFSYQLLSLDQTLMLFLNYLCYRYNNFKLTLNLSLYFTELIPGIEQKFKSLLLLMISKISEIDHLPTYFTIIKCLPMLMLSVWLCSKKLNPSDCEDSEKKYFIDDYRLDISNCDFNQITNFIQTACQKMIDMYDNLDNDINCIETLTILCFISSIFLGLYEYFNIDEVLRPALKHSELLKGDLIHVHRKLIDLKKKKGLHCKVQKKLLEIAISLGEKYSGIKFIIF